jgi:hypothetical protein
VLFYKDDTMFRPERFLDSRGTLLKEPEYFFPFSTGK